MPICLDHLIVQVNDLEKSLGFYTEVLGLGDEGTEGPFSVVRVSDDLLLLLAPWGTDGGTHLAFAMSQPEFKETFERIRRAGLEYGDTFHAVGNMKGPGEEFGAHGMGKSLYVYDPNRHLIEIRSY